MFRQKFWTYVYNIYHILSNLEGLVRVCLSFRNMFFIRKFTGQLHLVRAASRWIPPDYNDADENDVQKTHGDDDFLHTKTMKYRVSVLTGLMHPCIPINSIAACPPVDNISRTTHCFAYEVNFFLFLFRAISIARIGKGLYSLTFLCQGIFLLNNGTSTADAASCYCDHGIFLGWGTWLPYAALATGVIYSWLTGKVGWRCPNCWMWDISKCLGWGGSIRFLIQWYFNDT